MKHRVGAVWGGLLMLVATACTVLCLFVSGPTAAATCPYGPCTTPTTISVTPTTVTPGNPVVGPSSAAPSPAKTGPSSTAFTGAELALMFTIGAIAIGVGGMFVLMSRRRRAEPAYRRSGR